jgi:anti-sigma-K factor RskA
MSSYNNSSYQSHGTTTTTAAIFAPLFASQENNTNHNMHHHSTMWNNYTTTIAKAAAATLAAMFGVALVQQKTDTTECCGIAGVVGSSKNHDARYVDILVLVVGCCVTELLLVPRRYMLFSKSIRSDLMY